MSRYVAWFSVVVDEAENQEDALVAAVAYLKANPSVCFDHMDEEPA